MHLEILNEEESKRREREREREREKLRRKDSKRSPEKMYRIVRS